MKFFNLKTNQIFSSFLSLIQLNFSQLNKDCKEISVKREVLFRPRSVVFLNVVDPKNGKALYVKQLRAGCISMKVKHQNKQLFVKQKKKQILFLTHPI